MEPTLAVATAAPIIAAIVWFVRLEGRVNSHDTLFSSLFDEREKSIRGWLDQHEARDTERHHELRADLSEIRDVLRKHL